MKAPHDPNLTDSLSRALGDWRVVPPRNPQFRTEVRGRIEAGRATLPWGAFVRRHVAGVAVLVALAMTAGALGGHERAQARAAAESARLAAAYVQGLDARAMVMR